MTTYINHGVLYLYYIVLRCPPPPEFPLSTVAEINTLVGGFVHYKCQDGFQYDDWATQRVYQCSEGSPDVAPSWHTPFTDCHS